jgi:hypothetical protein
LKRLNDFQLRPLQIHILPAQAEQLPTPQAEEERQDVQGGQPVPGGSLEGRLGLCGGQPPVDLVPGSRDLNQLGDIARDDVLAHRGFQGVPEYSMD